MRFFGYKEKIISTIVDSISKQTFTIGYKEKIISTIVDLIKYFVKLSGYKEKIISTIVDIKASLPLYLVAIKKK